jgi:hypothetical protein
MLEHCHHASFCVPENLIIHRQTSDGFVDDVTHFFNLGYFSNFKILSLLKISRSNVTRTWGRLHGNATLFTPRIIWIELMPKVPKPSMSLGNMQHNWKWIASRTVEREMTSWLEQFYCGITKLVTHMNLPGTHGEPSRGILNFSRGFDVWNVVKQNSN